MPFSQIFPPSPSPTESIRLFYDSILNTLGWGDWFLLVAQWLRIFLPMRETWVWSLVQEDPTCWGAAKMVFHSYWASAPDPGDCSYWAHMLQALKPAKPRACAPQEEKPPRGAARALYQRVSQSVKSLSRVRLCDPMDCSPPGSSIHGIF